MARLVARRAERRHSRPVIVVADDSVVEAPAPALERAISNLVDNAAKFDSGAGRSTIEVAGGRLVVHDRGPGIAEADAGRIFDRFYRAEGARSLPGSGLGLSIVRDVVVRSGGRVEAADRARAVGRRSASRCPWRRPRSMRRADVPLGSAARAPRRARRRRRRRRHRRRRAVGTAGRGAATDPVKHGATSPDWGTASSVSPSLWSNPVTGAPQFEVFIDGDGVCIVRGELDEFTGSELETTMRSRPDVSTIDLGEVSFVDSAGLRSLLVLRQERVDVGGTIGIRRSSGAVRRVMRLAGVAHLFAHEQGGDAATPARRPPADAPRRRRQLATHDQPGATTVATVRSGRSGSSPPASVPVGR